MDRAALGSLGLQFVHGSHIQLWRHSCHGAPASHADATPKIMVKGSTQVSKNVVATKSAGTASRAGQLPQVANSALQNTAASPTLSRSEVSPPVKVAAGHPLPPSDDNIFTCLSYNVLLPNSQDGWWIYKYYRNTGAHCDWSMRQELLKVQLREASVDIICLQEVSDLSFKDDFSFLTADLGYDAVMHEKKGRMRPATFWKKEAWQLVSALHKDRTLVVALRRKHPTEGAAADAQVLFIVNAHLSAGPSADRRLRQVQEALDAMVKERKRTGLDASGKPAAVMFCGDFNSQGSSAVREFLVRGSVGPDFREFGDPTEKGQEGRQVTSKVRSQTVGTFADTAEEAFNGNPPATILAANIDSKMVQPDGSLSTAMISALEAAFCRYSSDGKIMTKAEVEQWLVVINGELGRGSEYRFAMAALERNGGEHLLKTDFLELYREELSEGKFWGVEHDLRVMGNLGLAVPEEGPCQLRFDYIYYGVDSLRLVAVQEPLTAAQHDCLFGPPWEVLPNAWHPSDHLPVAAAFAFRD